MAEYKMNQNAIDELAKIHRRLKLLNSDIHFIKRYADEGVKSLLKDLNGIELDAMGWKELYEKEQEIRDTIRFNTMSDFDWFRCDVDANCCNRSDYEPLKVEVVE